MTVATISERTLEIDDKAGSLTDYSAQLVGGLDALGSVADAIKELTNATDTRPQRLPTGFATPANFRLRFKADVGGSPDPIDDFYKNYSANAPRTVKLTLNTTSVTWSFQIECYISDRKLVVEPGEDGITLVEVEFTPTGSETITYS